MASSSERKLTRSDYFLLHRVLSDVLAKVRKTERKAVHQLADVDTMVRALYEIEHAYVVDGAYLVAFDIGEPWYVKPGTLVLSERIVLRLAVSGDFRVVPAFLERKAREAGCKLAVVGTALAKADAALASLYHRAGFQTECITLAKET